MFRKGKSAVEGDSKKSWSGIGTERELSKRRWGWRLLAWLRSNEKEASHLLGLGGRHQYSDQRSSRIRASCVAQP